MGTWAMMGAQRRGKKRSDNREERKDKRGDRGRTRGDKNRITNILEEHCGLGPLKRKAGVEESEEGREKK